jgi:putative permease
MIQLFRNWVNRYLADPQLIILGLLLLFGFILIYMLGNLLTPVFASIIIAYLLEGMVARLQTFRVPRMASVIIVFLLFLASMLLVFIGLLPMLSRQLAQLYQQIPDWIARGQKELMLLPQTYPEYISETQVKDIMNIIGTELSKLGQQVLMLSLASVRGVISTVVYAILVPLMVFFFLKDKTLIIEWLKGFLPEERRLATEVWHEVNGQVAKYVRGKIWEILIVWGASYITFKVLGLNFTALISLFVGLSVLIPYIGATVMYIPVLLVAYFQWGWGADFAYIVIAYSFIQLLDGNLLVPLLLSEVVNLHPVAIIVAVLVFGGLWGVWGLFFAIPLATLFHSVVKAWFSNHARVRKRLQAAAGQTDTEAA